MGHPAPGGDPAGHPEEAPPQQGHPLPDERIRDLPAGVDPDEVLAARPSTRRRSRLRRRVGVLQRIRELLLRDLGGITHEIHRAGQRGDHGRHDDLVRTKLERLDRMDAELQELETTLGRASEPTVLREPGVGGSCPACGELHGSRDRFCWNCGNPLTRGARRRLAAVEAKAGTPPSRPSAAAPDRDGRSSLFGRERGRRTSEPAEEPERDAAARATPAGDPAGSDPAGGDPPASGEPARDPGADRTPAPGETDREPTPGETDREPTPSGPDRDASGPAAPSDDPSLRSTTSQEPARSGYRRP